MIPIIHRIYYKPKIIKGSIRCYVRRNKFNILPSTRCVCRDIRGSVHYEFVPTGRTVNQVYYLEVLKRLLEKVRRKRPELFANNSWILHHDNAPAHAALFVREVLATKQITVFGTPCLFIGSGPQCLFFLFPKIKEILKGRHFDDVDDIWSNTTTDLKAIPQNQFRNCFEGSTRRWH